MKMINLYAWTENETLINALTRGKEKSFHVYAFIKITKDMS